jgi:hypothetical protein
MLSIAIYSTAKNGRSNQVLHFGEHLANPRISPKFRDKKHIQSLTDYLSKYTHSDRIYQQVNIERTSRDKSIIDALIFGIGYVLHHSPLKKQEYEVMQYQEVMLLRLLSASSQLHDGFFHQ